MIDEVQAEGQKRVFYLEFSCYSSHYAVIANPVRTLTTSHCRSLGQQHQDTQSRDDAR